MATATTSLRVYKPASGDTGWDSAVNLDLDILDSAIAGTTTISTTSGTVTLTNVDYANDQAKKAVLYCNGTLVGNLIIVVPNASRVYRVINATSGSYTVSIKTSSGSAVAVTQGTAATMYCDGSNTITFVSPMVVPGTGAPATSSGAAASSVSVSPTGNLSSTTAQAAFAELQGDIDTINTSLGNKQPLDTDLTTLAGLSNAKGNTIVGNGSAWAAVTVGTTGLVLRANNTQSAGVEWSAGIFGAITIFYQAAAPTGWTRVAASNGFDDVAVRLTDGTAGTGGGSTAFSTVFAARTIAQANLPNVTLTAASDGAHTHDVKYTLSAMAQSNNTASPVSSISSGGTSTGTAAAVSGGAHTHSVPLGGSGTAMDFAVRYLNFLAAQAS